MTACRLATSENFPMPTQNGDGATALPLPWQNSDCSPCVFDSQCNSQHEYCGPERCCIEGVCTTNDDCRLQAEDETYNIFRGYDSFGYDLNPFQPYDDLKVAQDICDDNPKCVGYNSYGVLKYKIMKPSLWIDKPPVADLPPWILYLKKAKKDVKDPKTNQLVIDLPRGINTFCALPTPVGRSCSQCAKDTIGLKCISDTLQSDVCSDFLTPTDPSSGCPPNSSLCRSEDLPNPMGICRECLACEDTKDCPDSNICKLGCCVNNPCYTAVAVNGMWTDNQFSRVPQCDCPATKPYCCQQDTYNWESNICSDKPCHSINMLQACQYICNATDHKHDSIMCLATQSCCNSHTGAPMCCTTCDLKAGDNKNACLSDRSEGDV